MDLADDKPNIEELWTSYCARLLACLCTDEEGVPVPLELRLERLGHEKQLFFDAAQDAIRVLRDRIPLKIPIWGCSYTGSFVQIDPGTGVPTERPGKGHVKIISSEDYRTSEGFVEALRWYADRGVYPVNSVSAKIARSIPQDLEWKELAQAPAEQSSATLTLHGDELRVTFGGLEYLLNWPTLTTFSAGPDNDFLKTTCQWSFHRETQTLWLRSKAYSLFFETGEPVTLQLEPRSNLVIAEFIRARPKRFHEMNTSEMRELILAGAAQAEADGSDFHCQRLKQIETRVSSKSN